MPSSKGESKWFETDLKPNGSTGYATRQSIWGSDWKFDPRERVKKPILKVNIMHNKVYVDNLAAITTERELIDLFSPYGNVAEVI